MVICHGHATAVIWIDADGNEVEHEVLCPDAALALLAATGGTAPSIAQPLARAHVARRDHPAHRAPGLHAALPHARGPPAVL